MNALTVPAWHSRVTGILDLIHDTPTPVLIGLTRQDQPSSALVYLDEIALIFDPDAADALIWPDDPPYALVGLGMPVNAEIMGGAHDGRTDPGCLLVAVTVDDVDSTHALYRPGSGWDLCGDMTDHSDDAHKIRLRLWDLLARSHGLTPPHPGGIHPYV